MWDQLGLAVSSEWILSLDEDPAYLFPVSPLWNALWSTIPAHRVEHLVSIYAYMVTSRPHAQVLASRSFCPVWFPSQKNIRSGNIQGDEETKTETILVIAKTDENWFRKLIHATSVSPLVKCESILAEIRHLCHCLQDYYFSQGKYKCIRIHQFYPDFLPSLHSHGKPDSLSMAKRNSSSEILLGNLLWGTKSPFQDIPLCPQASPCMVYIYII